jgi:hypothetical protein
MRGRVIQITLIGSRKIFTKLTNDAKLQNVKRLVGSASKKVVESLNNRTDVM